MKTNWHEKKTLHKGKAVKTNQSNKTVTTNGFREEKEPQREKNEIEKEKNWERRKGREGGRDWQSQIFIRTKFNVRLGKDGDWWVSLKFGQIWIFLLFSGQM